MASVAADKSYLVSRNGLLTPWVIGGGELHGAIGIDSLEDAAHLVGEGEVMAEWTAIVLFGDDMVFWIVRPLLVAVPVYPQVKSVEIDDFMFYAVVAVALN